MQDLLPFDQHYKYFSPPPSLAAEWVGGHCKLAFLLLGVLFSITDLDMYVLRKIFPPSEVLEVCINSHLQCFLWEKIRPVGAWEILAGGNLTRSDWAHLNVLESWKQYSVNNEYLLKSKLA